MFSELLEDECPFLLFKAKEKIKNGKEQLVLVKDVSHIKEEEMEDRLSKIAGSLADNLHMEAMIRVRVGYGNVVTQLPE